MLTPNDMPVLVGQSMGVGRPTTVAIPGFRTSSGLNVREHFMARSRRVKLERKTVGWALRQVERPELPCLVTLTRVAPSAGLDPFENLPSSLKGVVDAIAEWIGVDDKDPSVIYRAEQKRGPWAVVIRFEQKP